MNSIGIPYSTTFTALSSESYYSSNDNQYHNLIKVQQNVGMQSQFTGQWNLNSAFWTNDAKSALGYESLDSKTFYMTMNEYMQHMEAAYVNMVG